METGEAEREAEQAQHILVLVEYIDAHVSNLALCLSRSETRDRLLMHAFARL